MTIAPPHTAEKALPLPVAAREQFLRELIHNPVLQLRPFSHQKGAVQLLDDLFQFLFFNNGSSFGRVEATFHRLQNTLAALLTQTADGEVPATVQAANFFEQLPAIYQTLLADAAAIYAFDPAAQSRAEVILAYPGFYATAVHRWSHQLWKQGVRLLPRIFSEHAHAKTGIDIHPGAQIGEAFAIDHGTGIVIGETTRIGKGVKIYQGVTLGALHVSKNAAKTKRHPTIEDGVVIYAGATILGGQTVIGAGSIIGGNVWLTGSVPSNALVYHKSEIKIKDKTPFPEPIHFII